MSGESSFDNLTPWAPTLTPLPKDWEALADGLALHKSSLQRYGLKVRFNAQRVGDLLRSWGLPWQVVIAGYLWASDEKQIRGAHLQDVDQVLSHITQANRYLRAIEHEDLPLLLAPPYDDLGALLIAVAICYQELVTIQQLSSNHPYTGKLWVYIESVGKTLLNITKLLGMWQFKREIENVTEQLRSPHEFAEMQQEHESLLQWEAAKLENIRQILEVSYWKATQGQIAVHCAACGIAGMKRRQQDAHTTVTSQKTKLTGLDLVTFNITVPTVRECYDAFGVLSQLGYIQDRVTDHIAKPKPNGCSHIAFGLILQPQSLYTRGPDPSEDDKYVCQLQIATQLMQAIIEYGCLHPSCYQLYTSSLPKEEAASPTLEQLWHSEEGKIFYTIQNYLASSDCIQPGTETPIVVYDKNRRPIPLPKGATALDFAFALGSMIGEHAVDVIINNRKAPLYRQLDAGDVVEIITARKPQIDEHYLDKVTTIMAPHQIKNLDRASSSFRGFELLSQELERYHSKVTSEELDQELYILLTRHDLGTHTAYLEQLSQPGAVPYTVHWAAQHIMQQIAERNEPLAADRGRSSWIPVPDIPPMANKRLFGRLRLCNLCQPTYPRDIKIMGRLRKGKGELIVHKESCPYLMEHTPGYKPILLPMNWQTRPATFKVGFIVIAQDRVGLLLDITRQLYRYQRNLLNIHANVLTRLKEAHIRFTIETHDDKEALDIQKKLLEIENVMKVEFDPATTPAAVRERLERLCEQHIILSENTDLEPILKETLATAYPRKYMLDNPFDISRPATGKMFFGRSEETEKLEKELCEGRYGKAFILYGPRRSGKSSICKNFMERRVRLPFWGVLFSLQNFTRHNEETILRYLSEAVSREFEDRLGLPAPDWQCYKDSDPQARFHRLLRECIAQVPNTRLVLALDEFGGALESYERGVLDYRFFTYWKELMNEVAQLSLILALPTSSHNTLTSREFVNAFSFADNLQVTFLDAESAQKLLLDPLQERNIGIFPSTLALAIKMTGRNPYYVTLLGQHLIQSLNREPYKERISNEDIYTVVDQIITGNSSQNFDFLEKELQNEDELRVLEAIVELTRRPGQSKAQLKKIAAWLNQPDFITRRHLDRLRNGLILQENGLASNPYYTFTIELVHRWLTRNRNFFSSKIHK